MVLCEITDALGISRRRRIWFDIYNVKSHHILMQRRNFYSIKLLIKGFTWKILTLLKSQQRSFLNKQFYVYNKVKIWTRGKSGFRIQGIRFFSFAEISPIHLRKFSIEEFTFGENASVSNFASLTLFWDSLWIKTGD